MVLMDFNVCEHCGAEIEGKGIHYQGHNFCSDECCEEFDAEVVSNTEPGDKDLVEDLEDDLEDDESLGYQDKDHTPDNDDPLDEDYEIREEDF